MREGISFILQSDMITLISCRPHESPRDNDFGCQQKSFEFFTWDQIFLFHYVIRDHIFLFISTISISLWLIHLNFRNNQSEKLEIDIRLTTKPNEMNLDFSHWDQEGFTIRTFIKMGGVTVRDLFTRTKVAGTLYLSFKS